MSEELLEHWPRPLFVPHPLQSLFYFVVYGTLEELLPEIPSAEYRTHGLPEGLKLNFYSLLDHPEWLRDFQRGTGWDQFLIDAPQAAEATQNASTCLVLRGELPDAEQLDTLRDCIGLIMFLLDHGGSSVCDVLTGNWYHSLDWRLSVFDEREDASSALVAFFSIAQPNDRLQLYTRGLRRYARPDLSLSDVRPDDEASRMLIIQHLARCLVVGGSIPDGQQLHFPELATSVTCRWHGGLDDPFFYNFWLELKVESDP